MKKTVKVNLSGTIFHLDEDAYEKLNAYLEKIHRHFRETEGGSEIINDIELRMAELFQSKLSDSKQVITINDVTEVINNMGDPEDFTDEQEEKKSTTYSAKKLYRDPDDAILGGVAAGIGAYINVDPVWIRLLFVLLMLGFGFIAVIYILLWIFVPRAETYSQKLEMKGEKITITNIEKNVRKEYEEVKGNFKKFQRSEQYKNFARSLNEIFQVLGKILRVAFQILLMLVGIAFIFAGIAAIFSVMGASLIDFPFHFPDLDLIDMDGASLYLLMKSFLQPDSLTLLLIALFVLVAIPILFIIYAGVKLLINFKANHKAIIITGTLLWIAALLYIPGNLLWQLHNMRVRSYILEEEALGIPEKGNLILTMDDSLVPDYYIDDFPFYDSKNYIHGIDREGNIYLKPSVVIHKSEDDSYRISIKKTSRGRSLEDASEYAEKISYSWQMRDSTLTLATHLMVAHRNQYRFQKAKIRVMIPEGKRVTIHEDIEDYLENIPNDQDLWKFEMGGKTWKMGEELMLQKN